MYVIPYVASVGTNKSACTSPSLGQIYAYRPFPRPPPSSLASFMARVHPSVNTSGKENRSAGTLTKPSEVLLSVSHGAQTSGGGITLMLKLLGGKVKMETVDTCGIFTCRGRCRHSPILTCTNFQIQMGNFFL
jgi:hypothetical protein